MCPSVKTVCLVAGLFVSGAAQAEAPLATIPEALKAGPEETLLMVVPARGVQIYECRSRKDQPASYDWAFIAPQATLFDTANHKIGEHFEGPTWESDDGSRITGTLKARADAPQGNAIPWLLLTATASGNAKGAFGAVTSVQRVNTTGGLAPATPCTEAKDGAVARVPYTADYYFLGRR